MKKSELRQIIRESLIERMMHESSAREEAEKLGLDYMSFGRWGKNGKQTHQAQGDKLVPVDSAENSKKGWSNADHEKGHTRDKFAKRAARTAAWKAAQKTGSVPSKPNTDQVAAHREKDSFPLRQLQGLPQDDPYGIGSVGPKQQARAQAQQLILKAKQLLAQADQSNDEEPTPDDLYNNNPGLYGPDR